MRNFVFTLLLLLQCTLCASSDSELPKVNPLWQEVFTYGYGDILYDGETNSVIYQYHMWLPWLMTHHPRCYCIGTFLELYADVKAIDFEETRLCLWYSPKQSDDGEDIGGVWVIEFPD